MGETFEFIAVICFGLSWPPSVYKSTESRTAKGKSLFLEVSVWTGYVSTIVDRIVTQNLTYIFYFYILNIIMVSIDTYLYLYSRRLDALAGRKA